MKNLFIPLVDESNTNSGMEEVTALLATLPKNDISHQPWPIYKSNCQTSFSIAHNGEAIFLNYEVWEDVIKINTCKTNGAVNKDNCVEFFVSFGTEEEYYNIEINCAGIIRLAYGKSRLNRKSLSEEAILKIITNIEIKTAPINSATKYVWQITLIIPTEVFEHSDLKTLNKLEGSGNFFKCGDDLPDKHFYSWNMINAEIPDFHLPNFFGKLNFG